MTKRKRNELSYDLTDPAAPLDKLSALPTYLDTLYKKCEESILSNQYDEKLKNMLPNLYSVREQILLKEQKENILCKAKKPLLLPQVLWELTAGFLNETDLAYLTQVSKNFVCVYMAYKRTLYRKEFPEFDLNYRSYAHLAFPAQLPLFNDIVKEFNSFSTLIDGSYTPLFAVLKKSDQENAIRFINRKLQSTVNSKENVTDMVFFQKMTNGETAITLAQKLHLQNFLDFCFEKLILNGHILNKGKYSLVKTGKLETILRDTQMQTETMWMYACAYVCNQKKICYEISQKPFWDKTFRDDSADESESLSLIATLLSSYGLLVDVTDGLDEEQLLNQHFELYYEKGQIYWNNSGLDVIPLSIALISNNTEMINFLLPITENIFNNPLAEDFGIKNPKTYYPTLLMPFSIRERNLAKLKQYLIGLRGKTVINRVGIAPKYFGMGLSVKLHDKYNVLDLVLATQWAAGADVLLTHAATCKDAEPLGYVIGTQNLRILKLLVAHGLSLFSQYRFRGCKDLEYPLIAAFLEKVESCNPNNDVSSYIVKEIGKIMALRQILDKIQNRGEQILDYLSEPFNKLIKDIREFSRQYAQISRSNQDDEKLENILSNSIFEIEKIVLKEQKENILCTAKKLSFLPQALLELTTGFLNKTDLSNVTKISKQFVFFYMSYTRTLYRKNFPQFDLNYRSYASSPFLTQLQIFDDTVKEFNFYSTFIDVSYIPLFTALKKGDEENAIRFITSKLQSTLDSKENVTDMVFFQKMTNGETAITLAQKLHLQNFLDFCFEKLILNGHILNKGKYSLVKTGKLETILSDTRMQTETMWMYACAYVCNQKNICNKISQKAFWDKTFRDDSGKRETLLLIAALLSSYNLLVYVTNELDEHDLAHQHCEIYYEKGQIYWNNLAFWVTPLRIAIISNNRKMIKFLLSTTAEACKYLGDTYGRKHYITAVKYAIRLRKLSSLKIFPINGKMLIKPLEIAPKYFGMGLSIMLDDKYNILDLVLATQWAAGADWLLTQAAMCKDAAPLAYTLRTANLPIFKLLVTHGLSLSAQYRFDGFEDLEHPLIVALWAESSHHNNDISSFIIEKIGKEAAFIQISDKIQNPGRLSVEFLSKHRYKLLKEIKEFTGPVAQIYLSGTNLSILSGRRNNPQNTPAAHIVKFD